MSDAAQHTLPPIEKIRQRLELEKESEGQWSAQCPAHDDHRASLSVGLLGVNGVVGVRCHAGCNPEEVVAAMGLTMSDLFPERPKQETRHRSKTGEIAATYDYCDAAGDLVF